MLIVHAPFFIAERNFLMSDGKILSSLNACFKNANSPPFDFFRDLCTSEAASFSHFVERRDRRFELPAAGRAAWPRCVRGRQAASRRFAPLQCGGDFAERGIRCRVLPFNPPPHYRTPKACAMSDIVESFSGVSAVKRATAAACGERMTMSGALSY
jgi:hypothetical protein